MYEDEAVSLLGRFLFRYDQMRQPVGTLSGGERTRLQLCLLMLSGANCLLLDEPTNHLDIESMEVLESTLEGYDGTVVVISHDRYLLDRIPDRIVEVRDDVDLEMIVSMVDWLAGSLQDALVTEELDPGLFHRWRNQPERQRLRVEQFAAVLRSAIGVAST